MKIVEDPLKTRGNILIALLLLSSPIAYSAEKDINELGWTSVASANADDVHECKKDYDLALSVMQQRQKDNNLIEAMQTFTDKKLVMDAYSKPQQKTIRLRIEASKNFANHSAQWCFKWRI